MVAESVHPHCEVQVLGKPVEGQAPSRFVPDTKLVRDELGLTVQYDLRRAVQETIAYHKGLDAGTRAN